MRKLHTVTQAVKINKHGFLYCRNRNNPTGDSALETTAETYRNTQCDSERLDEAQHYLKHLSV